MSKGLLFWLIMVFWILFGGYTNRNDLKGWALGGSLIELVLFFLLGWAVFGFVVQ